LQITPLQRLSPHSHRDNLVSLPLKFLPNTSIISPEPNGVPSMKTGLTVTTPSSMIQPTSPSDAAGRAKALQAAATRTSLPSNATSDRLSTAGIDQLRAALKAQPEIRPEAVERGRALAADPAYPSPDIIRHISAQIVGSPDLADAVS
jgi:hypothetical protein